MENLFRFHVQQAPEKHAVVDGSVTLTYAQLFVEATKLSDALSVDGPVENEEPIGILFGPGHKQVIAQVAVRMAGATCVPIEPSLPMSRISDMLQDINAHRAICDNDLTLPEDILPICMDGLHGTAQGPDSVPAWEPDTGNPIPSQRSHILFTSGSTGRPKAVQIEERAILNLATETEATPLQNTDRVAEFNNSGFDLSLFEIWAPLLSGATVVVVPKSVATDPCNLLSFLTSTGITIAIIPTALFNIIASVSPDAFRGLRHVIVAGDAANANTMQAVLQHGPPDHLWNAYGPTECTTFVTMLEVTVEEIARSRISIGYPIRNTKVFLLNEDLSLVGQDGEKGEICLTGAGLSRGYINRDRENERRFIGLAKSALGIQDGHADSVVRLYRTGDIGQWRLDHPGCLDYIGRRDNLVKHLGFRVELEEVENVLESHEQVTAAAVIHQPPVCAAASSVLIAYIIPRDQKTWNQQVLVDFAREKLPHYMVPTIFKVMDGFPMSSRGKLDRKMLVDEHNQLEKTDTNASNHNCKPLANQSRHRTKKIDDRSQPGNNSNRPHECTGKLDTHRIISNIWKDLLNLQHIDNGDDFFLLGGTSIQSAALIALIKERLGRPITMEQVHANSRLSEMANMLEDNTSHDLSHDTYRLLRDADLAQDIQLVLDWNSEKEGRVFLTGATGFVGAHLLYQLIQRPSIKHIACLVRRKGSLSAASRLQQALERYDLWPESFELVQKIIVLDGSMADDTLGLGQDKFTWLTQWASVVFHLGAKVNYSEPYEKHYEDNVLGTRNVLNVAALGRRKAFHYMSSIDVWGPTGLVLGTRRLAEDDSLDSHLESVRHERGYGKSQWVAEAMVQRMRERGLPVAIYRPGFILGDSRTGAGNPDDFIARLIVGCIQLGTFPRATDMRFEYVPVDYVLSAMLHIASSNTNLGQAYHLVPPDQSHSPTIEDTWSFIKQLGYPVELVDYPVWLEKAAASTGPLAPLVPLLQEHVLGGFTRWEAAQHSPVYDCSNVKTALADSPDIRFTPVDSQVLRRYLGFWNRKGFYRVERPKTL